MPIYSGSTKIDELHIDGVKVGEAYMWDGAQWVKVYASTPPFAPSGIDKNGNQRIPTNQLNAWHRLTNWSVRSGFPDTVIVDDGIMVPAGLSVTVRGHVYFAGTDGIFGGGLQGRIIAGSTVLVSAAAGGNSRDVPLAQTSFTNTTGSPVHVTMEALTNSQLSSRNVISGGANTYLIVEPA